MIPSLSYLYVGDLAELDEVVVEVGDLVEAGGHLPQLETAVGRVKPGPRGAAAQAAHVEMTPLPRRLVLKRPGEFDQVSAYLEV